MSAEALPEKPSLDGLEATWSARWEDEGIYRFDRSATREQVFSVDTPPPTVSGSIHMGTIFGYTQFDAMTRYQRMAGRAVFFPIGWDDNGLATERRVQNYFGVRCDPNQPFAEGFEPPFRGDVPKDHREVPISRRNFITLCEELTHVDEQAFEEIFRRLGMSFDWSLLYQTVGEDSRRVSQQAFLRNLARGEAYSSDAPTVWDVDDRTAVAQAEIEDRERPGAYHQLAFHKLDGSGDVVIDTTRPELLVSCVALVAHPDDERYQPLFGTTVRTPLFGVEVPVVADELAQPDKGTGIAMICTFGDTTDVTWWRQFDLPTRTVIGRDGRFTTTDPAWLDSDGVATYAAVAGKTIKQAQAATVEALRASGELIGEPRPISHAVKFYERGSRPLEIVASRQWYIRNGGRDDANGDWRRQDLLARGKELVWYPDHMRHRYEHWVGGLNGDWLISRQRFFGVPIPLWYPLDADGNPDHDHPIVPDESALPVDPPADVPAGYTADQRDQPGGFTGDPDVMDTWATSSLTPQIAGRWATDPDLFERIFPMDIRPQGPEIIRTWLFATVVRAHYEHGSLPWTAATINGWILDPDRKKMSKSKGNVVTPTGLFDQHGADAVRYWALAARRGVDTAFSEEQMKVGRRLAMKLLNVSKFVLGIGAADGWSADATPDDVAAATTHPVDRAMLARLDRTVASATAAYEQYDYARGLEAAEAFFWWFCDDYVELVKSRAYSDTDSRSARWALRQALATIQRLFAPSLPFVAAEVWNWWRDGSVHVSGWPQPLGVTSDLDLDPASAVLAAVRRSKTEAKVSQRAAVESVAISAPPAFVAAVEATRADLVEALTVADLALAAGTSDDVEIVTALAAVD